MNIRTIICLALLSSTSFSHAGPDGTPEEEHVLVDIPLSQHTMFMPDNKTSLRNTSHQITTKNRCSDLIINYKKEIAACTCISLIAISFFTAFIVIWSE